MSALLEHRLPSPARDLAPHPAPPPSGRCWAGLGIPVSGSGGPYAIISSARHTPALWVGFRGRLPVLLKAMGAARESWPRASVSPSAKSRP